MTKDNLVNLKVTHELRQKLKMEALKREMTLKDLVNKVLQESLGE